jgi:hypothetical protein
VNKLLIFLFVFVVLIFMVVSAKPALADHHCNEQAIASGDHWYDNACCNCHDCRPVELGFMKWTPEGWLIAHTKELVPHIVNNMPNKKIRRSRDSSSHWCSYRSNPVDGKPVQKTRCIYLGGGL